MSELGNQAIWQEITPIHGGVREATIGLRGELEWLGIETTVSPAGIAQRAARRLIASGHVAGVVALYPAGREIAVAVAYDKGAALPIRLDSPGAVALAALRRLRSANATCATGFAARAAEILAGRGAGQEFFCQFRATLDAFASAMTARGRLADSDRRTLALVQLTRVLFLYFVQSKGWLDGRDDYLAAAVDDCLARRRGVQRRLLDPLFFGTLNRPRAERTRGVDAFGRIPFLNGGLFEPHPLERRGRPSVPDEAWRDAFDSLFERFHFTVSEGGAGEASIAPDMLGRVFEGVMAPADRKASGTFYTPASLVLGLVDAALSAALAARRTCSDVEAAELLARGDRSALTQAVGLTILDPACGSGAFLLGALDRLATCRIRLGECPTAARREVLRRNLFGVDADAIAVRLAELRLWLAVIADDPATTSDDPEPLPNLDCLIRQGDSLFAPAGGVVFGAVPAARMQALRLGLTVATGQEKRGLSRELTTLELEFADRGCRLEAERLERKAGELVAGARAPDLFGRRPRPSRRLRETLSAIRSDLRAVRAARRRLAHAAEVPWFHYEGAFADVFAAGGFDIVIGNPPWVRAEQLPATLRERLCTRYRWWRTEGARGFAHRPDLSVAFLERAHELVRPGGTVTMLVPSKLLTAGYGAIARGALATTATVHAVADLTDDPRADFGATVYPMALVTTRRSPPRGHRLRVTLEPSEGPGIAQALLGAAPWIIDTMAETGARLRALFPPFGERFRCALGVKTGADAVFLDPPDVEPELLRWALRGRDIRPFAVRPRRRILWTHDESGRPLDDIPVRAQRHFSQHERVLLARADYLGGPAWTLFRVTGATGEHRVVWADLASRLTAVALDCHDAELIPLNTCYVARTGTSAEAHAVAAWLNSTWIRALARSAASPASAGYARFSAGTIRDLPLFPRERTQDLAAIGRCAARGGAVQVGLDNLVADILTLSATERRTLAQLGDSAAHRR